MRAAIERWRRWTPAPRFMIVATALATIPIGLTVAQTPDNVSLASFHAPTGPNVVRVVAREYAFTMADTLPAGLTTFRLDDQGKEMHHFTLVRLDRGRTMADFAQAMQRQGAPPAWVHFVGGPNAPQPGHMSNATVDLTPGYYVALCLIPDPTGVPHFAKGMMHSFVVPPSAKAAAAAPKADIAVTLGDYDFTFSRPLTSGHHVIAVTNSSSQPHEMVIDRYQPGHGNKDFVIWAYKPDGKPSPGYAMGGVTAIPPGGTATFEADFPPGRYGLVCFVPDGKDGKPHFMHGMEKELVLK